MDRVRVIGLGQGELDPGADEDVGRLRPDSPA
jgi:hypothetical protein